MKTLFPCKLILLLIAFSFSCEKQKQQSTLNDDSSSELHYFSDLVAEDNSVFSRLPELMSFSFLDRGNLQATAKEIEDNKHTLYILEIVFTSNERKGLREKVLFTVNRDEALDFPKEIKNAFIVFLNNQLVVKDLDSDFAYNFFVPLETGVSNKTPEIETESVVSLGISNYDESKAPGCICYCQSCFICPSDGCSCSSNCNGCSVSCRSGNNAVCSNTCPIE